MASPETAETAQTAQPVSAYATSVPYTGGMTPLDRQIRALEDAPRPTDWRARRTREETLRRLRAMRKRKPIDTTGLPF